MNTPTVMAIHRDLVGLVLAAGVITLVCGLILLARVRSAGPSLGTGLVALNRWFRRLLWITAGIGVLQAIVGGLLFIGGGHPKDTLHFVYGLIVLGAIPVAYVYSDQKDVRRDIIIMVIAVVAFIGAAVRAFMTGI